MVEPSCVFISGMFLVMFTVKMYLCVRIIRPLKQRNVSESVCIVTFTALGLPFLWRMFILLFNCMYVLHVC